MVERIAGPNVGDMSTFVLGDFLISKGERNKKIVVIDNGYAVLPNGDDVQSIEIRQKIFKDDKTHQTVYLSREVIAALYAATHGE